MAVICAGQRDDGVPSRPSEGDATTLDTYGHIWPDRDESTRAAVDAVLTAYRTEQRRNNENPSPEAAGQGR